MKVLILGAKGMAGHVMVEHFRSLPGVSVYRTTRDRTDSDSLYLDACDEEHLIKLMEVVRPDVTINCIGLLNEEAANREQEAMQVNALLPHRLRRLADKTGGRLVHISTDCVFKGTKGSYAEEDLPDGDSVYAKTKAMGEVRSTPHLTIRTSIIGPEWKDGIGLFHWFMKQQGKIFGYRQVAWNGVTTVQLAKSVERLLAEGTSGLVHLTAPATISKYELLRQLQILFNKEDVQIVPVDAPVLDRTLRNTRADMRLTIPDYPAMLLEMKAWMEEHQHDDH